jgi:hypothetical protein
MYGSLDAGVVIGPVVRATLCVWVGWCGHPNLNRSFVDFFVCGSNGAGIQI